MNALLDEVLCQIETTDDTLPPLNTVTRLRQTLGRYSHQEFDADFSLLLKEVTDAKTETAAALREIRELRDEIVRYPKGGKAKQKPT